MFFFPNMAILQRIIKYYKRVIVYLFDLQVLESAGIMKNIKRVAGASAGAIIATLIALGYDSKDLQEFLEQDLRRILVGEY